MFSSCYLIDFFANCIFNYTIYAEKCIFKIAGILGVSRRSLDDYFNYMEKEGLIPASKADFTIGDFVFEIGGKNKNQKQIKQEVNSFIVKDNIEFGFKNTVPLWAFGMNY